MIEVTVKKKYSEEDVAMMYCMAVEGSINYWCHRIDLPEDWDSFLTDQEKYNKELVLNERIGIALNRGASIIFQVDWDEDGELKPFTLTLDGLKNGLQQYMDNYHSASTDMMDWDAEHIDVIMQYALFDEVVFG